MKRRRQQKRRDILSLCMRVINEEALEKLILAIRYFVKNTK